jgi:hypothetical protein
MINDRWKRRPEGSTWGDFGPDDQLGRINLLTPARVRAAAAEVKEGLRFCLSLPLDVPNDSLLAPFRHSPRLRPGYLGDAANFNRPWSDLEPGCTDVLNDDVVVMYLQSSTQWDSHMGAMFDADGDGEPEIVYYNGFRGGEHIDASTEQTDCGMWATARGTTTRVDALGIENMAAAGVRGVA